MRVYDYVLLIKFQSYRFSINFKIIILQIFLQLTVNEALFKFRKECIDA